MEHSFIRKYVQSGSRLGFHYFPDHLHYRPEDLQLWIPQLKALGVGWLILQGEAERAIPEDFIHGLKQESIQPIIHFSLDLSNPISVEQLEPVLSAYAKWGIQYVIFFDKPNLQSSWDNQQWSQPNLAATFNDQFLPLAQIASGLGLTPVFPPMEPGGQYWDTVFLQQALEEMLKRGAGQVLDKLALSAYGWTWEKSLNWGSGGLERWPQSKPYHIPPDSQDQRGLRTYEWYQSIAKKATGKTLPIILLQMGLVSGSDQQAVCYSKKETDSFNYIKLIQLLNNENVPEDSNPSAFLNPITEDVICGNIWLLSCQNQEFSNKEYSWWDENGEKSELAASILNWIESFRKGACEDDEMSSIPKNPDESHAISRYVFFPSLEYFLENQYREEIQDYLLRHQPAIGFSLKEAAKSAIVEIGADEEQIPDGVMDALRECGCSVRRLWPAKIKEVNEDYGEELADYPCEKDFDYAEI